jgi:hypothetical protein
LTIRNKSAPTALLLGPVAYHRLVFRRGQKESLVRAVSVMAINGLAAVGLAVSAAVLLVTSYVASGLAAALITAFVAGTFGVLWFAFPLARRRWPRNGGGEAKPAAPGTVTSGTSGREKCPRPSVPRSRAAR